MSRRWRSGSWIGLGLLVMAGRAQAQAQDVAADVGSSAALAPKPESDDDTTSHGPTGTAESSLPTPGETPLVWKRWLLFDPFADPHESGLAFEWTQWREIESRVQSRGASLGIAAQVSTVRGPWASTIRNQTIALRALQGPTFAIGLAQYDLLGGLDLGFLRVGAGAGILPVSLDYGRGDFSVALASPRAVASLSFKVGALRIAIGAATSYLLRVWGRGHVVAQSLGLEILLEKQRQPRLGKHPLSIR